MIGNMMWDGSGMTSDNKMLKIEVSCYSKTWNFHAENALTLGEKS